MLACKRAGRRFIIGRLENWLSYRMLHDHAFMSAFEHLDPLVFTGFIAILSYSCLSSLHCAAMCGPLVCARLGSQAGFRRSGIWLYNLGRALSYPMAGALAGGLGSGIAAILAPLGRSLSILLAALLLLAAVFVFLGRGDLLTRVAAKVVTRLFGAASRRFGSYAPSAQMLALGAVTATLPCMTLTPVLLIAAAGGSALKGAALLFAFFVGTLPVMVIAPIVPARLEGLLPRGAARMAAGLFLLLAGFTTLVRAL